MKETGRLAVKQEVNEAEVLSIVAVPERRPFCERANALLLPGRSVDRLQVVRGGPAHE
jgi:hypothetical protein